MSVQFIPPYTPLLHSKTGVYRGIPFFFLFLLKNIDCGYSLEPPRRVSTIYVLSKNKKNVKHFLLKIFIFYNFRNHCILHGHVFVMFINRRAFGTTRTPMVI